MRRLLVAMLICLIIVPLPLTAQAQERVWNSGCGEGRDVMMPLIGEDLYNAACEAYTLCVDDDALDTGDCTYPMYDALINWCEDDCFVQSSFYMASLLMFDRPLKSSIYAHIPSDVQAIMGDTLLAFQAGDYRAVIDLYEAVEENAQGRLKSPFQDFIVGLMYEELDELEAAAAAYRDSIQMLRLPFVTERRAQVLIELGYEDAAAAEALVMGDSPAAEAILTAHPLADDIVEDWLAYRVNRTGISGMGISSVDFTMIAGEPFQLVFLSDGSAILLGAAEMLLPFVSDSPSNALFYRDGDAYLRNDAWAATPVSLTFEGQVGRLHSSYEGGDLTQIEMDVLIAPADAPDPREGQDERCEGGARWQLEVDSYGAASRIFEDGTPYYDAVNGEVVGALNRDQQVFRVVDGPVCVGNQAWWEIELLQDDGQTYWLPEAEAEAGEGQIGLYYYVYPIQEPSD